MSTKQSYRSLISKSHLMQSSSIESAKLFIEKGVWNNITQLTLKQWLGNFKTDEEKLLSAFLLDAFIYRSDLQTNSLLSHAFSSVLPCALEEDIWSVLEKSNLLDSLTNRFEIKESLRIVPVIRQTDSPTKSGPLLARLYRRNIDINTKYFIWHWQIDEAIKEGIKNIVFIDDIIASGNQFSEFIEKCNIVNPE